jgi:hypothetical protein
MESLVLSAQAPPQQIIPAAPQWAPSGTSAAPGTPLVHVPTWQALGAVGTLLSLVTVWPHEAANRHPNRSA